MDKDLKEYFAVSVVMPVYNAELYLEQSVESALAQVEVKEVLLVDDGSKDKSLDLCMSLAKGDSRVRLFTHKNHKNMGPAATRNLGINQATQPYIAFLDADDFYLLNRFSMTKDLFAKDPSIDGVYEAVGAHFESEEAERRWRYMGSADLTTIRSGIAPEELFYEQSPVGQAGHCHLNGLTLKTKVVQLTGYFDTDLRGPEDTAFFIKLSAFVKLVPGQVTFPIAMRRVHASNAFTKLKSPQQYWRYRVVMWLSSYNWLSKKGLDNKKQNAIIQRMLYDLDIVNNNLDFKIYHFVSILIRAGYMLRYQPLLLFNKNFILGIGMRLFRSV